MARVEYREPGSVEEALALLGEYGEDAKVLAGGQSLLVMMRDNLVQPRALIALQGIPGLDQITAGVVGSAGVDVVILPNLLLTMLARYDLFSGVRHATARAGFSYVLDAGALR